MGAPTRVQFVEIPCLVECEVNVNEKTFPPGIMPDRILIFICLRPARSKTDLQAAILLLLQFLNDKLFLDVAFPLGPGNNTGSRSFNAPGSLTYK